MPDACVLVLTMVEDDDAVFAAIRAGALGYVLKGAKQDEIGRAVRGVAAGEAVYGPSVARRVRAFFTAGPVSGAAKPFPELTEREREVLDLIASGASNADIARRLFVSDKTVRNHVTNIFAKTHVADRSEAIVRAREAGGGRRDSGEASSAPLARLTVLRQHLSDVQQACYMYEAHGEHGCAG
jgi:DNA-binding NarL/FixJ family response regulator